LVRTISFEDLIAEGCHSESPSGSGSELSKGWVAGREFPCYGQERADERPVPPELVGCRLTESVLLNTLYPLTQQVPASSPGTPFPKPLNPIAPYSKPCRLWGQGGTCPTCYLSHADLSHAEAQASLTLVLLWVGKPMQAVCWKGGGRGGDSCPTCSLYMQKHKHP
jgi:hypothetical protein